MATTWKNLNRPLKAGIIILCIGTGPFLLVMLLDSLGVLEAGNLALGTGPLVGLTFYPSIFLIIWGFYLNWKNSKNQKENLPGNSKN